MATGSGAPDADAGTGGAGSYRERLTPTGFGWFAAICVGASLGLVVLPLAGVPGFVAGAIVGAGIGIAIMALTSALVEITADSLQAGRARIGLADLGAVEVLDQTRMAELRGRGIDPRAYHCQRGWLPTGVKVDIRDAADPTPYWLISSRHPAALARALQRSRPAS
jgi:Protein of unknown function (DUF3093)